MLDSGVAYARRHEAFSAQARRLESRYNRLAWVRLAVFILGLLGVVYAFAIHWLAGGLGALTLALLFAWLVRWHLAVEAQARYHHRLAGINAYEARAWAEVFPPAGKEWHDFKPYDGAMFLDAAHPNAVDLDLFGPFSLFRYLNRAASELGRRRLAGWLASGADVAEVNRRQQAVAELSERLDWRHHFLAEGMELEGDEGYHNSLLNWLAAPAFAYGDARMRAALLIVPPWMAIGIGLSLFFLSWSIAFFFLLLPVWIIWQTRRQVEKIHQHTAAAANVLSRYARMIACIEREEFKAEKLATLRATFRGEPQCASLAIRRLAYIIAQLDVRYNMFAVFLNLLGLWDLQWVYRLERWKDRYQSDFPKWFDALAEMEALSSLAALRYNHPDWVFPSLHDEPLLAARELGHPLIHRDRRVGNDLRMPLSGHIRLITGSNMAGKTTFLRAAGINIVLAMCGAPVCAREWRMPPLRVFTSMRTQDDLHENTSSFLAELKRLKMIIDAVEDPSSGGSSVFFLLDEILKGTNSRDRHSGARALIGQLIRAGGGGLIATHDLELGSMEADSNGAVENWRMEVDIVGGQLRFDYKLKRGISQSFNATLLMRRMGIQVDAIGQPRESI
jgi:hypothetical protein